MTTTAMAANDPTLHNTSGYVEPTTTYYPYWSVIPPTPTWYPQTWWFYQPPFPQPPAKCPGCGRCNTCGKKDDE